MRGSGKEGCKDSMYVGNVCSVLKVKLLFRLRFIGVRERGMPREAYARCLETWMKG